MLKGSQKNDCRLKTTGAVLFDCAFKPVLRMPFLTPMPGFRGAICAVRAVFCSETAIHPVIRLFKQAKGQIPVHS